MGTLFVVSTPIGNLDDVTVRAMKTLFSVDFIACEDTRRTGLLLHELHERFPEFKKFQFRESGQLLPFHDHNEANTTPELIEYLKQGKSVALVSDAGTPLINDPGFLLVREALKRSIKVISIPGPTAAIAALSVSGLPTNQFLFLGYPLEKSSHRLAQFNELLQCFKTLKHVGPTFIYYCAPHKLEQTLLDMKEVFGDIEVVLARELTKIHEEVIRGRISKVITHNYRGELVLLFTLPAK